MAKVIITRSQPIEARKKNIRFRRLVLLFIDLKPQIMYKITAISFALSQGAESVNGMNFVI